MDAWLLYLLKVCFIQVLLFGLYWLLLRKETFHQTNRLFLLGTLAISLVFPLLPLSYFVPDTSAHSGTSNTAVQSAYSSIQSAYYTLFTEALRPAVTLPATQTNATNPGIFIYWGVVCILSFYFLIQLFSVFRIIRQSTVHTSRGYLLANNPATGSPFSFFKYVVIPRQLMHDPALDQIVKHERVHVQQWHTIDIVLAQLYTIFFWFNPFAWWHKKAIKLNLEYLADKGVLATGTSTHQYQINLLKIHLAQPGLAFTSHFNKSFIKNRIYMMNSKASPEMAKWKYLLTIPLLCGLAMFVTLTKAEEVESNLTTLSSNLSAVVQKSAWSTTKQGNTRIINGLVKDADTDRPIHRAHIRVKGQAADVRTDALGRFSIEVKPDDKVLVVETFPYQTVEMALTPLNDMTILLRLSERAQYEGNRHGPNGIFVSTGFITANFNEIITLYRPVAIMDSPKPLPDSVMYIIDGKRVDKTAIQALDPEEIEKVMVFKRYEAEQRFGKGAGPGVVDVYLKK